jgi:hypothetical protein
MGGMRRRGGMQSQELYFLFVHYYFNMMHPRCMKHSVGKWFCAAKV